ncbi:MAG: restriction endonuclease subunit S [Prevotella sp.]|nr:restriction endonuclease subunit S [Prevotella sp.]
MREGWEYKKLGEVATFVNGDRGKNYPSQNDFVEDGIPFINAGHLKNGVIDFESMNYINEEKYDRLGSGKTKEGDLLFCLRGSLGKRAIVKGIERAAIASSLVIIRSERVFNRFLYYYLGSTKISIFIQRDNNGSSQPNLSAKSVSNFVLSIPPLPEQERIVSELDLLSSIIEKKKAQLKEYDQLAQSIFYDMFGDPVSNEKGWEVKRLIEVSSLLNGRAYKQDELLNEGKYKVLRVGNFFTNSNYYYSDLELDEDKYCECGDLLFAWSASFGAFIWDGEKVIYHYHIWKVLFDNTKLNKIYYQYLLNTMTSSFMKDVHGIGMVHLTKVGMEQYMLPLPPLSLQQSFAEKIEAIERQKTLIQQSITETETLFNSRMEYYFN